MEKNDSFEINLKFLSGNCNIPCITDGLKIWISVYEEKHARKPFRHLKGQVHFRVVGMAQCSKQSTFINLIMTHNRNGRQHSAFIGQNGEPVKANTNIIYKEYFLVSGKIINPNFLELRLQLQRLSDRIFNRIQRANCFFPTAESTER